MWGMFVNDGHAHHQRQAILALEADVPTDGRDISASQAAFDRLGEVSPALATDRVATLLHQAWPDIKPALDRALGELAAVHLRRGFSAEELFERMRTGVLDPQQRKEESPPERLVGLLDFLSKHVPDEGPMFYLSTRLIAAAPVSNRTLRRIGALPASELALGATAPRLKGDELCMLSNLTATHSMTALQAHRRRASERLQAWRHDLDVELVLAANTEIRSGERSWTRDVSLLRPFRYLPKVSSGTQRDDINSAKSAFSDAPIDAIFFACRAFEQRFGKSDWRAVAQAALVGSRLTALESRLVATGLARLGLSPTAGESEIDEREQPLLHQRMTGRPAPSSPYANRDHVEHALTLARGIRNRREHAPVSMVSATAAGELARLLIQAWHLRSPTPRPQRRVAGVVTEVEAHRALDESDEPSASSTSP
jgi:hypothetical protein